MNFFPDQVTLGLTEIPDEISLIIPLAGCGHECEGCHSPEYQNEGNGEHLTIRFLENLLDKYKNKCSCVCIFGGEHNTDGLNLIFSLAKDRGYKTALYSGYQRSELDNYTNLDYIKVGPYIPKLCGIQSKTTNQRLYNYTSSTDITYKFWRNND